MLSRIGGHGDAITTVTFSTLDSHIIVSCSKDMTIRVWHIDTSELLAVFGGHSLGVNSIVFSADGWLLASGAMDSSIRIWTMTDVRELVTLEVHQAAVMSVAFHPSELTLASGSADGHIYLWVLEGRLWW